ncbi:MAG: hypothetical protein N3F04_01995 [Candidatus Nezhaarchaeota archaeon]|nr:hypothetical protein [Candidatus Nezhaarchaeota archaeon]MCX8141550.1 hypothetical protein [Candidatus Nezhaarchaeota archaeon]MDW8049817.1 hypothetical protein [Nitrososphaerota archaeon]
MDFVIKIGGSLYKYPGKLRELCQHASTWLKGRRCIITPGGGPFTDLVRLAQRDHNISDEIAHEMALIAVDQYGLMLSDMISNSKPVKSIVEARKLIPSAIPILLPSNLILSSDVLEHSWRAGSDCIAAIVARICNAHKLILVKDVDGVYEIIDSKLLTEVSLSKVRQMKTCLDPLLPETLEGSGIECIVVNGLKPDRVKAVIDGLKTVCTRIVPG